MRIEQRERMYIEMNRHYGTFELLAHYFWHNAAVNGILLNFTGINFVHSSSRTRISVHLPHTFLSVSKSNLTPTLYLTFNAVIISTLFMLSGLDLICLHSVSFLRHEF